MLYHFVHRLDRRVYQPPRQLESGYAYQHSHEKRWDRSRGSVLDEFNEYCVVHVGAPLIMMELVYPWGRA